MLIRQYIHPTDYTAVYQLWQTAGPGVHPGRSDSEPEIKKKLARDPDLFLVAEDQGRIIGTVLGGFDGRRGIIYHLAVSQEGRQQGIGSALMLEVEARLKAKGCIRCYLLVIPSNDTAAAFYTHRGWQEMGLHIFGKDLI